jgi:hypothetical protein
VQRYEEFLKRARKKRSFFLKPSLYVVQNLGDRLRYNTHPHFSIHPLVVVVQFDLHSFYVLFTRAKIRRLFGTSKKNGKNLFGNLPM